LIFYPRKKNKKIIKKKKKFNTRNKRYNSNVLLPLRSDLQKLLNLELEKLHSPTGAALRVQHLEENSIVCLQVSGRSGLLLRLQREAAGNRINCHSSQHGLGLQLTRPL